MKTTSQESHSSHHASVGCSQQIEEGEMVAVNSVDCKLNVIKKFIDSA